MSRLSSQFATSRRKPGAANISPRPVSTGFQMTPTRAACACGGACPRCRAGVPGPRAATGSGLEQEADRAAEAMLAGRPLASEGGLTPTVPEATAQSHRPTGAGRPLDGSTRGYFEARLGRDLAAVRVHTGADAQRRTADLSARAYTVGDDIVFNAGEYAPDTAAGRRLMAHELAHVGQQAQGGPVVQREPLPPGECDPANLGTLGPLFHRDEADVAALGLPTRTVVDPPAAAEDFVLYCPHRSSRPLKRLLACTTAYWVGDAEAAGKGQGKDEVWARLEGESGYFWGYVKKPYLSTAGCAQTETEDSTESGTESEEGEADAEEFEESEIPSAEDAEAETSDTTGVEAGAIMRVNAPNDPGWAPVVPNYLMVAKGEPHFFPHFLQVEVIRPHESQADAYLVEAQEGKYEGSDAFIHGSYLMNDPGSPGYAFTTYNIDTQEFFYGGAGPVKAVTHSGKVPSPGTYDLQVPDYPHDAGAKYGPYATAWFLIGDSGDKYFHPGMISLGCITVEIKMGDTTTWPDIWTYLIDARSKPGVVGTIEITHSPPVPDWADPFGGNTTGGPGNQVWHPPGVGQGGVPIDW